MTQPRKFFFILGHLHHNNFRDCYLKENTMTLPEKNCSDTISSLFHLWLEKAPYQASPGSRVKAVCLQCWYLSMICLYDGNITLLNWQTKHLCVSVTRQVMTAYGGWWRCLSDAMSTPLPPPEHLFSSLLLCCWNTGHLLKQRKVLSTIELEKNLAEIYELLNTVRTTLTWSPSPAPPLVWPPPRWSSELQDHPPQCMLTPAEWGDHWPHSAGCFHTLRLTRPAITSAISGSRRWRKELYEKKCRCTMLRETKQS